MFHYGMIAEVKIFNRALSIGEIEADYREGQDLRKGVRP
jgi:hypothetical protein